MYLNTGEGEKSIIKIGSKNTEETEEGTYTEEEMRNDISEGIKIQIPYKEVNTFKTTTVNDEQMAKKYYTDYRYKMLYKPEKAYEMLDKEYREKRFGNYENYLEYLNDIVYTVAEEQFNKYKIERGNNYTMYTIAGKDNRKYYIKESSVMQYVAYLDNYTIISEDQEKEYEESTEEEKAQYNISKFITMVEEKDYMQSYDLLDEEFKKETFPTKNDFKDYVKGMFYTLNTFRSCTKIDEGPEYSKYEVKLIDSNASTAFTDEEKIKIFYVKLEDGMNFKIRFEM